MTIAQLLLLIADMQTRPSASIVGRRGEFGQGEYSPRFDTAAPPVRFGFPVWSRRRCAP